MSFGPQLNNVVIYQNDHLGTPQQLTAVNGAVVWSAKYSSFGEAEVDPSSTIENNLRFPGQYFDRETGLYYNWHRYYDPRTGRYLRTDPIGLNSGDINFYRYAKDNPLNDYDPKGLYTGSSAATMPSIPGPSGLPREIEREIERIYNRLKDKIEYEADKSKEQIKKAIFPKTYQECIEAVDMFNDACFVRAYVACKTASSKLPATFSRAFNQACKVVYLWACKRQHKKGLERCKKIFCEK